MDINHSIVSRLSINPPLVTMSTLTTLTLIQPHFPVLTSAQINSFLISSLPFISTVLISSFVIVYPMLFSLDPERFDHFAQHYGYRAKEQYLTERILEFIGAKSDECRDALVCTGGETLALKYPLMKSYVDKLVGKEEKFFNSSSPFVSNFFRCLLNKTTDHSDYKCQERQLYSIYWRKMVNLKENEARSGQTWVMKLLKWATLAALSLNE